MVAEEAWNIDRLGGASFLQEEAEVLFLLLPLAHGWAPLPKMVGTSCVAFSAVLFDGPSF